MVRDLEDYGLGCREQQGGNSAGDIAEGVVGESWHRREGHEYLCNKGTG